MKKFLIIVVVLALAIGLFYWNANRNSAPTAVMSTYTDTTVPLSFEYRYNPAGYIVQAHNPSDTSGSLVKTVVVMQKSDYDSIQRGERAGGEGPPTITIQIFRNTNSTDIAAWVNENPQLTNFGLKMGETTETTVDGVRALFYNADGLYPNRNVVLAKDSYIYHIHGSYLDQDSALYRDFGPLLDSIKL